MQIQKRYLTFVFILSIVSASTYASTICEQSKKEDQAVHCVSAKGVTSKIGKYIAIEYNNSIVMVGCFGSENYNFLPQDYSDLKPGLQMNEIYYQCKNKDASSCDTKHRFIDTYIVTQHKVDSLYSSNPYEYVLNLDPNYGENCKVNSSAR